MCFQVAFGQTNIAVPSYASVSNSFNASTGNIKFYLNGVSQTLSVGRGANGVCFYGSDMFVAMDDGIGTKGIIWYANVSFSSGSFTSNTPVVLGNGQGTFSVATDASGNIYSANDNGTVTKLIRNNIAPFYSAANVVNTIFWSNGGFAEASGVFVDTATQTLWAVSYANNQGAVVKLSDFDYADGFGNNTKIKRFADNNMPNTLIQNPEGIAKDASGNIWIGNNNNNYVLRLNNTVVTTFINDLDAADYSFVTLNATQLNDFAVSANGHQLGGLVYDNLYSSKMYVNDQQSGGNTFVYSFTANNSTPTFSATSLTQIYPGAGQCAIIPCALLPTPSNPTASGATINSGQTAILTASNCAADQTYLWKQGSTVVGNAASFTTPVLNANATYTAHCVRAGSCQSSGTSVTVTVGGISSSPNTLPSPALVGYLHNWDDSGNGLPYIQLDNVPAAYNVINYAFGVAQAGTTDNIQLTLPTNVDANATTRTNTFIQKMNVLQNQGKKVLLSLGGAVNSGGVINVGTITKRDNFITSVTTLLKTYPFDGLDIDIEGGASGNNTSTLIFNQNGMTIQVPNSPTIDNLIYALKQIMLNYRGIRGKKMLLTFAPERHHITGGFSAYSHTNNESSAAYLPIIEALKDSLDLVHTQLYGYGSDLGKNGSEYCVGTEANALAVTEDLMLGYTLLYSQGTFSGLPSNKIALGFATPCNNASNGFLTPAKIQSVVNYFRNTGAQPAAESPANCNWMASQNPYAKISASAVEFRGLMTWSINYDVNATCSNNSFATTYTGLYGAFTASVNPKNILTFSIPSQVGASVINSSANTITVTMPFGTVLTSLTPTFTLSPNTATKKASGTVVNFSAPVQYTVNHQDNSSKTWTVIVNVSNGGLTVTANPTTVCAGNYSLLIASGCAGNVSWNTGATGTSIYLYPNTTTTYSATCSAGGSSSATVTVNPNPAPTITSSVPITISDCGNTEVVYLHTNQTTTLTASGCTGAIKWDDYTNTYSGTTLLVTAPSLNPDNGMKYINITCTNSNGCVSNGFMTILNQFATDDNYTTPLNTPFSGNVITNDTETSVGWGAYGPTTTAHGTISWVMGTPRPTGAFTYTPNTGFQGVDTFTYYVSDDLTCSKRATVTITVGTPPCPTNIVVDGNSYVLNTITGTASFNASNSVSTTALLNAQTKIGNTANVTFQGGNAVTLSPGFSTQAGAVFTAKIGACPNVVQPPYTVQKTVYQYGTDPNLTPLIVDIYQPSVATSASRKPLIIFTHGTGSNNSNPHGSGTHAMAQYLAENQGFVAAYFNFYGNDNTRLQDDGLHLLANYDAVITYLQNNAATYGINPNAIILHGTSGSAAGATSVAIKKGMFGAIIEAGGRNIGIESYEPASIATTVSIAGVQSQSDAGFGGYRYNTADVRSGASHNYNLWTENTALAQVAYPGQQGYCTAWNDCSLTESFTYYTTKYGNLLIRQYPLVVTGQSHGPDATTQTQWTNFMRTTPKLMLNDRGITW